MKKYQPVKKIPTSERTTNLPYIKYIKTRLDFFKVNPVIKQVSEEQVLSSDSLYKYKLQPSKTKLGFKLSNLGFSQYFW